MNIRRTADEDLKIGDTIRAAGGWNRIVGWRPYDGTLPHIVFAIAELANGRGVSLTYGGETEVSV